MAEMPSTTNVIPLCDSSTEQQSEPKIGELSWKLKFDLVHAVLQHYRPSLIINAKD